MRPREAPTADTDDAVVDLDIQIFFFDTGDLRRDEDILGGFENVDLRVPGPFTLGKHGIDGAENAIQGPFETRPQSARIATKTYFDVFHDRLLVDKVYILL
jgi:hypothetical protein